MYGARAELISQLSSLITFSIMVDESQQKKSDRNTAATAMSRMYVVGHAWEPEGGHMAAHGAVLQSLRVKPRGGRECKRRTMNDSPDRKQSVNSTYMVRLYNIYYYS